MRTRTALTLISCTIGLCGAATIHADDPFGVAQRTVNELYVKPLHLARAMLKVDAEPFPAECSGDAITIRVLLPVTRGQREVLKVDVVVLQDRLQFLGASGSALHGIHRSGAAGVTKSSIAFLEQLNGWTLIEEPLRRGARKGYVERRMRVPKPQTGYEPDVKTIVFDEAAGLAVLIGAPPAPTAKNCSGE
jgi:hypothetical protein